MVDSSALLAHIIAQTKANVEFLELHRQISAPDARDILAKLPSAESSAIGALSRDTQNLLITPPSGYPNKSTPPPPSRSPSYSAPVVTAKAIWGYNEGGQDPNDLCFRAGDIIEIVSETNVDWWTGRYNGREGLFPSNYVEKIKSSSYSEKAQPPTSAYTPYTPPPSGPPSAYSPGYQPPPGGYQPPLGGYQPPPGGYQPPPGGYHPPPPAPYQSYSSPPPPPPAAQPPPEEPKKESKFGGLGNTLAHSAAGGVGFGAGSAVGSGIINSIF